MPPRAGKVESHDWQLPQNHTDQEKERESPTEREAGQKKNTQMNKKADIQNTDINLPSFCTELKFEISGFLVMKMFWIL